MPPTRTPTTAGETAADAALRAAHAQLVALIARQLPAPGVAPTAIAGLTLYRRDTPSAPVSGFYPPSLGYIVQGRKRITIAEHSYLCDARCTVLTAVDLPTVAQIVEASTDTPYMSLLLTLDPGGIAGWLADTELAAIASGPTRLGLATADAPLALVHALCRLVALLDEPEHVAALAPLLKREILYRLLTGEHGARLRQMVARGGHGAQIATAIGALKAHFDEPLRVDALAAQAAMAPSTFRHHFRAVTAMSPLQYQKQLRLHEARRLMLVDGRDAAAAAFEVGYESASQFSREYARLFGAPPRRDIARWRAQQSTTPFA
jgi:AraC-like DNA-binding protein